MINLKDAQRNRKQTSDATSVGRGSECFWIEQAERPPALRLHRPAEPVKHNQQASGAVRAVEWIREVQWATENGRKQLGAAEFRAETVELELVEVGHQCLSREPHRVPSIQKQQQQQQ